MPAMASQWLVPTPSPGAGSIDLAAVAALLAAPRSAEPGRVLLDVVNRVLPVQYLSVVAYGDAEPRLLEGHARRGAPRNATHECWRRYRQGRFWRQDELVRLARRVQQPGRVDATAPVVGLHVAAHDIPNPVWREQIYEPEQLSERFTLVYAGAPNQALGLNFYRCREQGGFAAQEITRLLDVAPLLCQAHRLALEAPVAGAAPDPIEARVAAAAERLAQRAPMLPERERAVCARIACGLTADGIAADLGIAPSTVVTLRKRAYARLGVHDRLALARLAH